MHSENNTEQDAESPRILPSYPHLVTATSHGISIFYAHSHISETHLFMLPVDTPTLRYPGKIDFSGGGVREK
jgi:hypothetical protein